MLNNRVDLSLANKFSAPSLSGIVVTTSPEDVKCVNAEEDVVKSEAPSVDQATDVGCEELGKW